MGIKLPQLSKIDWFYLCAAWQKNEIEKRLAWMSPTYRDWNPRMPWGTEEGSPQNTSLNRWRRWNWLTDGTPNKWLNVPYEYPWYAPAGQLASESHLRRGIGADFLSTYLCTGDIAKWNPSAYQTRPGPSKETHDDYDVTWTIPIDSVIEYEYYLGTEILECSGRFYYLPAKKIRPKGTSLDENGNWVWPLDENGLEIEGTVYRQQEEKTFQHKGLGNDISFVFWRNRLGTATAFWKYVDEYDELDTRHVENYHYVVEWFTIEQVQYWYCDGPPPWGPYYPVSGTTESQVQHWETRSRDLKRGSYVRWEVNYKDEWKWGAYQKAVPYPCYKKVNSPSWVQGSRDTHITVGSERPTGPAYFFPGFLAYYPPNGDPIYYLDTGDPKTEVWGGNGIGEPLPYQGATNTWYQRYGYKPSQHWADGWGIRNESVNFYAEPEYRVGIIYNGISQLPGDDEEADPMAVNNPDAGIEKFNGYFWKGSHKMITPFVRPNIYVGEATIDELGLPRSPQANPNDYESVGEYLERTGLSNEDLPYPKDLLLNRWHTQPINHNSANDLYRGLFKEAGVDLGSIKNQSDFVDALGEVEMSPGESIFSVPAFPPAQGVMLDTVHIYNELTLVPTDWVFSPWSPIPITFIIKDRNLSYHFGNYTLPSMWSSWWDEDKLKSWWSNKQVDSGQGETSLMDGAPTSLFFDTAGELMENIEITSTPTLPIRDISYSWGAVERPSFIHLANYPTGFEIDPRHEVYCQTRLIGETEMNHRCESIPNWLDTDGGLLYYAVNGTTGVNEGQRLDTTYFFFVLQSRLPSGHHAHQSCFLTVELMFEKTTTEHISRPMESYTKHSVTYDVVRYKLELFFQPNDGLNPTFDGTYYPADTDPGRSPSTPPSTPSTWNGPSTYPEYDIWRTLQNGDITPNGKVQDKRDWQAFGPSMQIVSSVPTFKLTTEVLAPGGVYNHGKILKRNVGTPTNPVWEDYEDEYTKEYAAPSVRTVQEELTLEDVKIVGFRGNTYRSFTDGGPNGP